MLIGIVKADKCKQAAMVYFGYKPYGFAYGAMYGWFVSNGHERKYGPRYDKDDVIDIYLDLKRSNQLSFSRNNIDIGIAAVVACNTMYRLAVGMYSARQKIALISFEEE